MKNEIQCTNCKSYKTINNGNSYKIKIAILFFLIGVVFIMMSPNRLGYVIACGALAITIYYVCSIVFVKEVKVRCLLCNYKFYYKI